MANMFLSRLKQGDVQVDYLTVTSMPTKTQYIVDDTLDLTGMVITATFTDGVTADVTSAVTTIPANGATLSTEGTQAVIVTYGKATVSFNVTISDMPAWDDRGLDYNSWATIQAYAQAGLLDTVASEGDTKSITIGGNTIHLQLASINDGTGTAGTYYPNGTADFVSVELLPNSHKMNNTGTNVGGWNSSAMRTYLNETIYPTLPSDLKNVIIEKTHMRTAGNQSTSFVSASDKLWLPTSWELFGIDEQGESATYNKHYSIFPNDSSRIKQQVNSSSADYWWESSPNVNSTASFCIVTYSGDALSSGANATNGVALCLRIG